MSPRPGPRWIRLARLLLWLVAFVWSAPVSAQPEDAEMDRLSTTHYTVEWAPGLGGPARRLAEFVEPWHTRIYGELGADASGHTRVTLLADERDLLEVARRRHPGSAPPEWAAGLAYPAARAVYLRADVDAAELATTLQHEISHIAMGVVAGAGGVPTWFTEGVAVRQSEPFAFDRLSSLTQAAMMDRLLPLDALDHGFPKSGARAGVAYAQSVHFVGWLVQARGEARFQALMKALGAPDGPERGFGAVVADIYGEPLASIESDWRGSLTFWWGWMPIVVLSGAAWALAGGLLVLAWRRRRRAQAERLLQMAGMDALDMAEDVEIAHNLRPPVDLQDPYQGRPPSIH